MPNKRQQIANLKTLNIESEVTLHSIELDDIEQVRDKLKNIFRIEKAKFFNIITLITIIT